MSIIKLARWCVLASVIFGICYVGVFLYARQSDAFLVAQRWVESSSDVHAVTGDVRRVTLDFFGGYLENAFGRDRNVWLTARIEGEKKIAIAEIAMKQRDGKWQIVGCKINEM